MGAKGAWAAGGAAAALVVCLLLAGFRPTAPAGARAAGGGPAAGPITGGPLVSVSVWKYPVDSRSNEGGTYKEGRVEVYNRFIIVTHPGGERTLHLHNYYTDLRFKAD